MSWGGYPVYWLRIAGLGDAGDLATLTTRPPPASWSPPSGVMSEAWPVLLSVPSTLQSSTTPLASDTPDQVLVFSASWRDNRIAPLAAAPAPPAAIDNAFLYLTKFYDPADGKLYAARHFNLDAIIAVGYRVNSFQATQFRVWATRVIRSTDEPVGL